jgi:uncharacterized protein (DUF697 family)
MFEAVRRWFSWGKRDQQIQKELDKLKEKLPTPLFWLFGKTQSGKTTVVKYLTGAAEAEVGKGFQPCTRFSQQYHFPTAETPLLRFLDTRGLDEPDYDPAEDLARFNDEAHVVLVTVKALDHAQDHVIQHLRKLRQAQPRRPVVLVLTCLHEGYPQQQHPQPYPYTDDKELAPSEPPVPEGLQRSLEEQRRRFDGLFDRWVAVDLTPADEGFAEPNYGGERLRQVLQDVLPAALGQTLISLKEATRELQDLFARQALPHIIAYSSMAATAGAVPIPLIDLVLISGIQSRMVYRLADLYGQPMTGRRFKEIASAMGLGVLARQASRGVIKLIPGIGSVIGSIAGGALAGASTFALGKAFCYYYRSVHSGHVPQPDDLRRYYADQLSLAQKLWSGSGKKADDDEKKDADPAPAAQGEAAKGE